MNYKKIILPILFFMLIFNVYAEENYHAYDENKFGNVQIQIGSDGAEAFGTVNNISLCIESVAPKNGYINSFYLEGGTWSYATEYCLSNTLSIPTTNCPTGVSGTLSLDSVENVTNYLNYEFYKGETFYICIQEPTNSGTQQIDTVATNSFVIDEGNETWDTFSSSDINDLKQYKSPLGGFGIWYHSDVLDWYKRSKNAQNVQFCMLDSVTLEETCYSQASKYLSIYGSNCGEIDEKVGEIFQWKGEDGVTIDNINMWLYGGVGNPTTAKFKIGVDEIDITDNSTFNLYLGGEHNYSEITNATNIKKITDEITFSLIDLETDNYYLIYFVCTSGCSSPATLNGICGAFNYWDSDSYFIKGFQDETGKMFKDDGTYNTFPQLDLAFLFESSESQLWNDDEETQNPSNLTNCSTNCTTWSGSSYLKEDFNGDISTCNWAVNDYYCWNNQIITDKTYDYYSIFKNTDLKYDTDSRYFTVSFDIKPADIEPDGYVSIGLYDLDFVKYVNVLFGDNNILYNNENGNAVSRYTNLSSSTTKNIQLHIDLTDDSFDLYYDGSLIDSGLQFTNDFYNADNIYGIRISSSEAGYILENLEIYATNQNNVRTAVDGDIPNFDVNEDESFCGYFTRNTPSCSVDSDCETGKCMLTGRCASFDFNYCDDNGKTRGNMCMVSAVTSCVLNSTGDIILDNFFLFLVFLIIIMLFVYLLIMARN